MKKFFLLSLITFNIFFVYSEEENEEETKKQPIFSFDILEEDDFSLYLEGDWKFDLSTSAQGDLSTLFDNTIFKQVPNFTASLWLFNKFFFETEIKEKSEDNLFLFGYQNDKGTIQEVRLGNSDINIGEYAGYTPPINEQKAPGGRIKVNTDNTTHEFLTRYTSEVKNSISYRGYNQLDEGDLLINNYQLGKFYILPFTNLSSITLYYIDDDNNFKTLSSQDYIYYKDRSLLYVFDQDIKTIYTDLNGLNSTELGSFIDAVPNPGVDDGKTDPQLWVDYTNNIGGTDYLLIKQQGSFSPFECMGSYIIPDSTASPVNNIDIYINGTKNLNFNIIDDNILFWDNTISNDNLKQRYPFIDLDSGVYKNGGTGVSSESVISYSLLTPVSEITVPTDAKKGSLSITINGIKEYGFSHDTSSGQVKFDRDISPFDDIVINYDTEIIPGTGNLYMSYGSRYKLKENLLLDFSHTGSWDFTTDDYSYEYNTNRGEFESRTRLQYESEKFSGEVNNILGVSNPDTLGKYLLFEYNQGNITIPLPQTTVDEDVHGSVRLIKRNLDDEPLTISQMLSSSINPLGGAYYGTHYYNKTSSSVLIIESADLSSADNSIASIDLGEYKNDYSFAREFSFEVYNNSGADRDLTITFENPGSTSFSYTFNSSTTKITNTADYKKYTIYFTPADREKLSYINDIKFKLENEAESMLLFKDLTFTGDSLVTHNGNNDLKIQKSNQNLYISKTTGTISSIEVSSRINSIDINKYNHMKFNIEDTGLLNPGSNVEIELKSFSTRTAKLVIPSNRLISGTNKVDVSLASNSVTINGHSYSDVTWSSNSNVESNSVNFNFDSDGDTTGQLIISEITLTDPKLDMYNKSETIFTYKPDISIKVDDFPILDSVEIKNKNIVNVDETTAYSGESGLKATMIGAGVDTNISYGEEIDTFKYRVQIPYNTSPLTLSDSFEYNVNISRENKLEVNTNYVDFGISMSDFKNEEKGQRESKLNIGLFETLPIRLKTNMALQQTREDEIGSIDSEFSDSYTNILLEDVVEDRNQFTSSFDLSFILKNFNMDVSLSTDFIQDKLNTDKLRSGYLLEAYPSIAISKFKITPGARTNYKSTINENYTEDLSDGFNGLNQMFQETHPYSDLTLNDMFFNKTYDKFYLEYINVTERYLDSKASLNVIYTKEVKSMLDMIIPSSVTVAHGKTFSEIESKQITLRNLEINGEFVFHPVIKNSVSFKNSLNLEEDETIRSVDWLLKSYKEFQGKKVLEVSNNFNVTDNKPTNVTTADYTWPGKSGPVMVVPLINRVLDNPYQYTYKEKIYLKFDDDVNIGIRHDTVIKVKETNETNLYIDISYDTSSDTQLYFEAGITFTLIF